MATWDSSQSPSIAIFFCIQIHSKLVYVIISHLKLSLSTILHNKFQGFLLILLLIIRGPTSWCHMSTNSFLVTSLFLIYLLIVSIIVMIGLPRASKNQPLNISHRLFNRMSQSEMVSKWDLVQYSGSFEISHWCAVRFSPFIFYVLLKTCNRVWKCIMD